MRNHILMRISVLLAALSLAPVVLAQESQPFDVLMFPAPTGPYQVGRITRNWLDVSRDETLTDVEDDRRELVLRIWYPAEVETGVEPALATEDLSGPQANELITLFHLDVTDPVVQSLIDLTTYAYRDVPLSGGQSTYPVLIFSPGYCMVPEDYTTQVENLASHGYVVAGINHPYYSAATVFPDGRVVACLDPDGSSINKGQAQRTYAEDIIFVLNQLASLNVNDPDGMFSGRLDMERTGIIGSSLGGDSVALAGSLDNRIRAILSEDGSIPVDYELLAQPFLLFATTPRQLPTQGPNYTVWVAGFVHSSFTDYVILIPGAGSIESKRTVEIIRAYSLAFFDKYLKGKDSGLLDAPSQEYPEAGIRSQPETDP